MKREEEKEEEINKERRGEGIRRRKKEGERGSRGNVKEKEEEISEESKGRK